LESYDVYYRDKKLGNIIADNPADAISAGKLAHGRVTSACESKDNIINISDAPKEYFVKYIKAHFEKMRLENISWNKLPKEELYRIFIWIKS
jgi:hypothetical protein